MLRRLNPLLCLVAALGLAHAASALPVNHGNFVGTSVTFQNVTETTQSAGDDECLFTTPDGTANDGNCATAPIVAGDQLIFFPSGFTATATGAGGADETHSLLQTMISANSGTIDTLKITEFGDVILSGTGTDVTNAKVSLSGLATVLMTNSFVDIGTVIPFIATYAPTDLYELPGDLGTKIWTASVTLDIAGALTNGDATLVQLSFDNVLDAFSETSSSATIQKKLALPSVVIAVPEPGAALLMLMGVGLLAPMLRSKRSAG